jgi:hypothetical protein
MPCNNLRILSFSRSDLIMPCLDNLCISLFSVAYRKRLKSIVCEPSNVLKQ